MMTIPLCWRGMLIYLAPSGWMAALDQLCSSAPHREKSFLSHLSKTRPFSKLSLLFPSPLKGALIETNNAHTLNRPTASRPLCRERRERIGQQVALPLSYHRTPLSVVGPYDSLCHYPHHPTHRVMENAE